VTLRRFELPPFRRNAELIQSALYISQYSEDINHLMRHRKYSTNTTFPYSCSMFFPWVISLLTKTVLNPALCLTSRDSVTRCFASYFFPKSSSLKYLKITLGLFQIFSKIHGDICKSRCTTGINNTSGKFAIMPMTPPAKLPSVSTTPAANLPPVSMTPTANFATSSAGVFDTGGKQWEKYQTAENLK
jgi:hypothetical protein